MNKVRKNAKLLALLGLLAVIPLFAGCATTHPAGIIFTDLKLPISPESDAKPLKTGTAESMSILRLVAIGDSSIDTAMKNGNITRISHVDWQVHNILGIIGNYKVIVYGE